MPSYAEILDFLIDFPSLTTKQLADRLGYTIRQIYPVLRRMREVGYIEKIKAKRPKKSRGSNPVAWKVRKSFKIRFDKTNLRSVKDMPQFKRIEEKRKANTGWCEKCRKIHPYPHKRR